MPTTAGATAIGCTLVEKLYRQRKATAVPVFESINSPVETTPYLGLKKVKPYLMLIAFSVQHMMYFNYLNRADMATAKLFLDEFEIIHEQLSQN